MDKGVLRVSWLILLLGFCFYVFFSIYIFFSVVFRFFSYSLWGFFSFLSLNRFDITLRSITR
jgi:hypothetical protein